MKLIKKSLALTLICLMILGAFSGCGAENKKITVVCTVFPIYDWVINVIGDTDAIDVKLLLSDGTDLHSFQPTAKDAIAIRTADIVIRVGGVDDSFVNELLEGGGNIDLHLMDAEGVRVRHTASDSHHSHDDGHHHAVDEHIWLSLNNAIASVEAIYSAVASADPKNAQTYRQNADAYVEELSELDKKYRQTAEAAEDPRLIFADRFPFVYLTADYGIEYAAAFEGCTADAEAGFDTILGLSRKLDEWGLSTLCVTETSDKKLYHAVCDLKGDKQIELAVFDSMQSVSRDDIGSGITYIKIMENNLGTLTGVLK